MDWIYDIETYPNVFTFSAIDANGENEVAFECSTRKNDVADLLSFLDKLRKNKDRMIGFNNVGFDYPVVHDLLSVREKALTVSGKAVAVRTYKKAQMVIGAENVFQKIVRVSDEHVNQVDLFKIHHFDNRARSTSLKMIEFNMRSDTIEDLPYEVGTNLEDDQIDVLLKYNMHDVRETLKFYNHSLPMLSFREELTNKYKRSFINHNDTKIGKDYFIMRLEEEMEGSCYKRVNNKRVIQQTIRESINIGDCLFNYYDFERPEFISVLEWFRNKEITETKGVLSSIPEDELGDVAPFADMLTKRKKFFFKPSDESVEKFMAEHPAGWIDAVELKTKKKGEKQFSYWGCWNVADNLNVVVDGFRFDFGTGGIHGSISDAAVEEDDDHFIIDADVASMYPNIAIANRVFPEHLGERFCDIYEDVYQQRKSYAKGTVENAMLKLALNGVYGDSNSQYSPFYDSKYTMSITINGQLSLCLLAEKLMGIEGLSLIQVNTDGITVKLPKNKKDVYDIICDEWQKQVGLDLEFAFYSKMIVRDVNNYIAVYTDGKVKRKGAYQYEGLGWHQDQGGLVIRKAAEAHILHRADIRNFITNHEDNYDFMMRTKVPRSSKLVLVLADGTEQVQQNTCRFYACRAGADLVKVMPPLKDDLEPRRLSIGAGWGMWVCNNVKDFNREDLDYNYYVDMAEKLIIG
jgi:hypothetical protein